MVVQLRAENWQVGMSVNESHSVWLVAVSRMDKPSWVIPWWDIRGVAVALADVGKGMGRWSGGVVA